MNRVNNINYQIHECQKQLFALGAAEGDRITGERFRSELDKIIHMDKYDLYHVETIVLICEIFFGKPSNLFRDEGHFVTINSTMLGPYKKYNKCTIIPPNYAQGAGEPIFDIILSNDQDEQKCPQVWGKTQLIIFFCLYIPCPNVNAYAT